MKYTVVLQQWTESERGWGRRPDGHSLHIDNEEKEKYVKKYWEDERKSNGSSGTPDEYSFPDGNATLVSIPKKLYDEVVSKKNIRFYTAFETMLKKFTWKGKLGCSAGLAFTVRLWHKEYPSIPGSKYAPFGKSCIAFYKYDGSNIRVEWSRKRGWYKFGTRRRLFDISDKEFGCAIDIFRTKYADDLEKSIKKNGSGITDAVAFLEFLGPNSFAGQHDIGSLKGMGIEVEHNDPKDLILFDVNFHKQGLLGPKKFLAICTFLLYFTMVY